ncbi:annexin A7-like [Pyrus ussuriensis x Pyrus communis]|uniref:Annexin A7-like n=1 Tax=Pyrus ussuriensis x Pyrus communis TaxID=2448454 RepID=A0A5N5IB47_9ROSA|nr:annexin A7-like [Pyrus ussuriensis x Pyrus communis]
MATSTPCSTYQEFFEVLLRVEDSENALDDSDEEEEKGGSRFQRQRNPNNSGAPLCHGCNNHHFGKCRQRDVASYYGGAYQYLADAFYHSGYTPYQGGYTSYAPYQGGGPQWYFGEQSQNIEVASSNADSTKQPNQPS